MERYIPVVSVSLSMNVPLLCFLFTNYIYIQRYSKVTRDYGEFKKAALNETKHCGFSVNSH